MKKLLITGKNQTRNFTYIDDAICYSHQIHQTKSVINGKERRIRPSKVVINNLFTRCQLRDVSRTDNNPHGLIMERYTVLNNKTIESHDRKN